MSVGEDKSTKWLQREGRNMLSIKSKFWFIQEPLDEKTCSRIRNYFQKRKCSNDKLQREIWSLVYQFAAFLQKRGKGFFKKRGGGGGARTPLDPGSP